MGRNSSAESRIYSVLKLVVFFTSMLLLASCGGEKKSPQPFEDINRENPQSAIQRNPWEVWNPGKDMAGADLKNFYLLKGDQHFGLGSREKALEFYKRAKEAIGSGDEEEALFLRLAGLELSAKNPQAALEAIQELQTRSMHSDVASDSRFLLIAGYAFLENGQYADAVNNFGAAAARAGRGAAVTEGASKGIRELSARVSEVERQQIALQFASDPFIQENLASTPSTTSPSDSLSVPTRTVAVMLPLSGRFGELGSSTLNGLQLAFDADIASQKVRLDVRDTAGDIGTAQREIIDISERLKPDLIIGPLISDLAQIVVPEAVARGIPVITLSKRQALQLGSGAYRLGATARSQVSSLLQSIGSGAQLAKFALVYPSDASGFEFAQEFKVKLAELGLMLVYEASYPPNDSQALAYLVPEIEGYQFDAMFFGGDIESAAQFLGNMDPNFRTRIKVLGPSSWDSERLLSHSRTVLEGAVFPTPFFKQSSNALVGQFISTYNSKYGKEPDFLAAQGYDLGTLISAALDRASRNGTSFQDAFSAIRSYRGLTGEISVLPSGEVERYLTVVELKEGTLFELSIVNTVYQR